MNTVQYRAITWPQLGASSRVDNRQQNKIESVGTSK